MLGLELGLKIELDLGLELKLLCNSTFLIFTFRNSSLCLFFFIITDYGTTGMSDVEYGTQCISYHYPVSD